LFVGVRKLTPTYTGWNKLPEWMDDAKKKNKVTNLLTELRQSGRIENKGKSGWVLLKSGEA
jgi:hypothetical protein